MQSGRCNSCGPCLRWSNGCVGVVIVATAGIGAAVPVGVGAVVGQSEVAGGVGYWISGLRPW